MCNVGICVKSGDSARLYPATGIRVGSSELESCRAGFTFFFFLSLSPFHCAIYSEFSPQRINQKVGDGKRNSTERWICYNWIERRDKKKKKTGSGKKTSIKIETKVPNE